MEYDETTTMKSQKEIQTTIKAMKKNQHKQMESKNDSKIDHKHKNLD